MPKPDTLDPDRLSPDRFSPDRFSPDTFNPDSFGPAARGGGNGVPIEAPGTVEIEADSVTEAMSRLAAEVGDDAQIVDARKVERGGIGGFFAKERVVLTARHRTSPDLPSTTARRAPAGPGSPVGPASTVGIDAIMQRAESSDDAFAALLRDRLDDAHPSGTGSEVFHPGTPVPPREGVDDEILKQPAPPPATSPEASAAQSGAIPKTSPPTTPGVPVAAIPGVDWGVRRLVAIGIPGDLVAPLAGLDPWDDLGWLNALAAAVAPLCATDPSGPGTAMVGRNCEPVATAIGIAVTPAGEIPPATGRICTPLTGSATDRALLELIAASRPLHIVIDTTKRWRQLLVADPALVSWTDDDAIGDALDLAIRLGARLGYAPADGMRSEMIPASPVDVVVAIRRRIGRRR